MAEEAIESSIPRDVVEGDAPINEGSSGQAPPTNNDDGLPRSFDVLVVGTGLSEAMISAAASRNGHSVLHLDPRDYYGGTWATFSLDQWTCGEFLEVPPEAKDVEVHCKEAEGKLCWKNRVSQFRQVWYDDSEGTKNELMSQKRRFNIDLMPKIIAAREDIVQLLIKSNVSRYLEFLRVARLLTNLPPPNQGSVESIPLSRADIFTSKSLTLVEKRSLVKLIEAVLQPVKKEQESDTDGDPGEEFVQDTFEELVTKIKVPEKLRHMVKSSITTLEDGFSSNDENFNREFCDRCRLYLNSIGRYGNQTPFLWTLYGISEICQAFCRLSAVYGGIFILKRHLSKIEAVEDGFIIKTEKDELKVKNVVLGPDIKFDMIGKVMNKKEHASIFIGRAVLITKYGNIKVPEENSKQKGDGIYVYRISGMEVIEMNHSSQAVPKDYRLLQVSFPIQDLDNMNGSCQELVEANLSQFINFSVPVEVSGTRSSGASINREPTVSDTHSKPRVIYGSYFILHYSSDVIRSELATNEGGGFLMGCGISSTELSLHVTKARDVFETLYPEEEFLPKAPDCEEADVMNGDDGGTEGVAPTPNVNPVPDQPTGSNSVDGIPGGQE